MRPSTTPFALVWVVILEIFAKSRLQCVVKAFVTDKDVSTEKTELGTTATARHLTQVPSV